MVVCFSTYSFSLDHKECKSFKQVIQKASKVCGQPQNNIKVYFVDSKLSETHIESDSDLLSLKYLVKRGQITFKILISKSKDQIQAEIISSQVSGFLSSFYEDVAQRQMQKQLSQQLQSYLKKLYQKVLVKQAKHKLKKIENEEVSRYMDNMYSQINQRMSFKRRCSIQQTSRIISSIPQSELLKRKQEKIEGMVRRILASMMPAMVQELSYRIIEQLRDSKELLPTAHSLQSIEEDDSLVYL